MKKIIGVFLLFLAAAYVGGYWPQHQQLRAAQQSAAQAHQQLSSVQAVARLCRLENDLLALVGQTENQNYGNARGLSNSFFDDMRREADRDPNAPYKSELENILAQRDPITAGLAKADPATAGMLRQILGQMEQLVGKLTGEAGF
jgi:hypothetical protein